ncbi:MAG: site-specific integrase, partial [Proteobacteria bacterium]|nr:site-specific integrase [Pseudomonadota bacterium]
VERACKMWLAWCEAEGLEPSTRRQYKGHVKHHIEPLLGGTKLSQLTQPKVEAFKDELLKSRSRALAVKILISLKAAIGDAQRLGLVGQNVARGVRIKQSSRDKATVIIPTKAELKTMMDKAPDDWRPLLVTAIFTGLRASELRGLPRRDLHLEKGFLRVTQRADETGIIGPPKTKAGTRKVPIGPFVTNTLKDWLLRAPNSDLGLVFPNGAGNPENHANILNRFFYPLQTENNIVDSDGKPKYGFHSLRHIAVSLFIEQGINPKELQTVIGHSSIKITYDTYGHLFDDMGGLAIAIAEIEKQLTG